MRRVISSLVEISLLMHLLSLKSWSSKKIEKLVDSSLDIKGSPEDYKFVLEDKSLAMIFQKTSTRTRLSFEVAMTQMGGHAIYMDWRSTNLILADLGDETRSISGYVDGIMARVLHNSDLQIMSHASDVPVINGCDEKEYLNTPLTGTISGENFYLDPQNVEFALIGAYGHFHRWWYQLEGLVLINI